VDVEPAHPKAIEWLSMAGNNDDDTTCTVEEAGALLLKHFGRIHRAREWLDEAIRNGDVRLLCSDGIETRVVNPEFFSNHLRVGIATDGRMEIKATRALAPGRYEWRPARRELDTLITPAPPTPPLSSPPPSSPPPPNPQPSSSSEPTPIALLIAATLAASAQPPAAPPAPEPAPVPPTEEVAGASSVTPVLLPDNATAILAALELEGFQQEAIAEGMLEIYQRNPPESLTPGKLHRNLGARHNVKAAKAKARGDPPPDKPAKWDACDKFVKALQAWRAKQRALDN
jgi:hypothetical protein